MRLIDIILESIAVEKAKQMGLVKKPGVALYGPSGDGNPASHKIRGGELTPLKSSGTNSHYRQTSSTFGYTTAPVTDPAPEEKSNGVRREVKVAPTPNIEDIAQKVMETISPEGKIENINQTLSVVTAAFGRESVPPIFYLTPEFSDRAGIPTYLRPYVLGVYIGDWDVLAVKHDVSDKPIDEWNFNDIEMLSTHIHEVLHSARQRPDNMPDDLPYLWLDEERLKFIDEGMTEYLTQEIMSVVLSNTSQLDLYREGDKSYPSETFAVRLMIEYGGLDVAEAYLNMSHTIDEETDEIYWDYMEQIENAHNSAFTNILRKTDISEKDIEMLVSRMEELQKDGLFSMFREDVLQLLGQLIESDFDSTNPPLSMEPVAFLNLLYDFLYF
jgi:hypothetical protein